MEDVEFWTPSTACINPSPLLLAGISHASHLQAISASPTVHTLPPLLHPPVWTSIPNGNSPRFLQKRTARMV